MTLIFLVLCAIITIITKYGLLRKFSAVSLIKAVWLFVLRSRFPILWVSVSYITRNLGGNQDIKSPDISAISNIISSDITWSYKQIEILTEILRQQISELDPSYNGKYPSGIMIDSAWDIFNGKRPSGS